MPFVYTDSSRNAAANGITAIAGYASLHTADPGATGANEVTGGAPAYARKPITWAAAGTPTAGAAAMTGTVTFDVPAGVTVTHVGLWSAATAGTFRGHDALDAPETYGGQGTFNLNGLTVAINNPA